ncbi:Phosphoglycolate phosphatase, partial [Thalictrum thalictroides]
VCYMERLYKHMEGVAKTLELISSQEEIFSSSFAAAMFLKINGYPQDKQVYVLVEEGLLKSWSWRDTLVLMTQ